MIQINLSAIPNQSLSVQLNGSLYDLTIKETRGVMCATISRDNILLISNMRMIAGCPLLPYKYLEKGNFLMLTANDEYPYYTKFGDTQILIFASQAELDAIRGT